jgi:hypothetical protein
MITKRWGTMKGGGLRAPHARKKDGRHWRAGRRDERGLVKPGEGRDRKARLDGKAFNHSYGEVKQKSLRHFCGDIGATKPRYRSGGPHEIKGIPDTSGQRRPRVNRVTGTAEIPGELRKIDGSIKSQRTNEKVIQAGAWGKQNSRKGKE